MVRKPLKIIFYVQHLLGIGHLTRASLICQNLVNNGHKVKMVMGGMPVTGFPDSSIDVYQLPVLKAGITQFNLLTDENGTAVDDLYLANRKEKLLTIYDQFNPDILIIEAFPFGRRQMRFELLPLLEKAQTRKAMVVGSVRDIVQENRKPKRNIETVKTLNKYFNLLLVHGDSNFVSLEASFDLVDEIKIPVEYTGLVAGKVGQLRGNSFDVVVSAGGGGVGQAIMKNAMQAKELSRFSEANWCFLVGPNCPPRVRQYLVDSNDPGITVYDTRSDFRALLAAAELSISQAGYNTTADILQAGCPSVLVPFSSGGETEQTRRANAMKKMGLAIVVSEEQLSPQKLANAINNCSGQRKLKQLHMDTTGGDSSVKLVEKYYQNQN